MDRLVPSFAALLRARRLASGMTQRELAARAGMSTAGLRDLEQGRRRRPRPDSLARLAAALGLDPAQAAEFARAAGSEEPAAGAPDPAPGLRISVLGRLTVRRGPGGMVDAGPPRQRALFGLLALHANAPVHRDSIIEALWPYEPPATASELVHAYVSRLRHVLEPEASRPVRHGRLATAGASYRLAATPAELDLLEFSELAGRAAVARAAGEAASACDLYEQALAVWQGEPLADVEVLRSSSVVAAVTGQRADAVLSYAAIAAERGWHERVLPWLRARAGAEPLNERVHAALMIAQAGLGDQAAARRIDADLSRRLDDQLGIRPGQELAAAQLRVLRQDIPGPAHADPPDFGLDGQAPRPIPPGLLGTARPRQLPPAVAHFTGRTAELASLTGLLGQIRAMPGVAAVLVIAGTAGVGKTALALHWAHRVADEFPDGQLYVDLRGYDPEQPMEAADVLASLLRSLGVAGTDVPAELRERAALYQSVLAGQRVLAIFDNAGSADQVRPLLPGTPGCAAVVTSRDSLAGLVVRDGAVRLDLDLLPIADAVSLLGGLIGDRADADPSAAELLAARCSRLPLALRVAAELVAAQPAAPLADLVGELSDQWQRLDLLEVGGDARSGVRAVFSWSYRHLDAASARAFRLIGLHPGPDLDVYAVAALIGTATPTEAERVIGVLTRAHLTQAAGSDRYGVHDLLRDYARELAWEHDMAEKRRAALTRLLDYYLHTAAAAMDVLYPAERHRRPSVPAPPSASPALAEKAAARAWLDAEQLCLVAVAEHAAGHGWPGHVTRMAAVIFRHLDVTGHFPELAVLCTHALHAARQAGDRQAEARAIQDITVVDLMQGRYERATVLLSEALALYRSMGDQMSEARSLDHLGIASFLQGGFQQAAGYHEQALTLYQRGSDQSGAANALNNLGLVELRLGRYESASTRFRQVLRERVGEQSNDINCLANLGIVYAQLGRHEEAAEHLRQALELSQETGNPTGEVYCQTNLALLDLAQGRNQRALTRLARSLALSREHGDRSGEICTLNALGEVSLAVGQVAQARAHYAAALSLSSQIGYKYEQAHAHAGLGDSLDAAGQPAPAREHWARALALHAELGTPEADRLRAQLGADAGSD